MNNALRIILLVATVASLQPLNAPGQNGVWSNPAGGSWSVAANWSNNLIPNSFDATADFSQLVLSGPMEVTLDGYWTVGAMVFGDVGKAYGWQIDSGAGGMLTLAAGAIPVLTVNNQTATITSGLAGASGLVKGGNGRLILVNNGIGYYGPTTINAGALVLRDTAGFASDITVMAGAALTLCRTPNGSFNRLPTVNCGILGAGTLNVSNATPGIGGGWLVFNYADGGLTGFTGKVSVQSGVLSMDNLAGAWFGNPSLEVISVGFSPFAARTFKWTP